MKRINYLKILKWLVKQLNAMPNHDKKLPIILIEKPYVCIMQFCSMPFCSENGELCTIFSSSIIPAAKTAKKYLSDIKFYLHNNVKLDFIEEDHVYSDNATSWLIDMLDLPIEQLMIKIDLNEA